MAIETPLTPDYVGTLRHACPKCHRPAAIRRLVNRAGNLTAIEDIDYCQWSDCDWQDNHSASQDTEAWAEW